ncbi:MAG: hypothetical protein Q9196_006925 [Gyalolechia fulgens]
MKPSQDKRQGGKADKRRAKEMMDNAPKPLPEPRARSLSLYRFSEPNSPCHFLTRLPREIREEIYSYVVAGNLVHVARKGKQLAHVRCYSSWPSDPLRRCRPAAARTCHDKASMLASTANGNLALLQTCRQIYAEAVHIMYARNTFDFDHQNLFLFFSRSILPQRLARIRSLELHLEVASIEMSFPWIGPAPNSWKLMWTTIAEGMPALKHLRVGLAGEYGRSYPDMNADWWLQCLLQVKNLKTFHLEYDAPLDIWGEFGLGIYQMTRLLEDRIRCVVCSNHKSTLAAR